ncbi:MAG TPA: hypothetical protein VFJ74_06215 [Gemmatimonadaceae bacterium]|nr:hypothetical protein [Gemmatimonadaceae bacterium]
MTQNRRGITLAAAVAALFATAACSGGKKTTPDDALLQDLQQASGTGVELAPQGGRTQVVSAIEMTGESKAAPERRLVKRAAQKKEPSYAAAPAPAKEEQAPAIVPTKNPEPAPSIQPTPEPTPAPAAESRRPEAPMPVSLPSTRNGRRGGYKSVGDVIRNAPFPINP